MNCRAVEELCKNYPFAGTLQFISSELEPLSPKAKKFFAKMPLVDWNEWRPRYIKLALLAAVHAVPQLLHLSMTWSERELFAAVVLGAAKPTEEPSIN